MFQSLTEKLSNAFKKFRSKGKLTEADVKEGMREVKLALLEADVNFKVVKDFTKAVTERAVGTEVLESLLPAQQNPRTLRTQQLKHHPRLHLQSTDRKRDLFPDFQSIIADSDRKNDWVQLGTTFQTHKSPKNLATARNFGQ